MYGGEFYFQDTINKKTKNRNRGKCTCCGIMHRRNCFGVCAGESYRENRIGAGKLLRKCVYVKCGYGKFCNRIVAN